MGKRDKTCGPPPEPSEPEGGKSWGDPLDSLLREVAARFSGVQVRHNRLTGEPALLVSPQDALQVALFLRDNDTCRFNYCRSVTGTDRIERFEVTYNLARLPAVGQEPSAGFATIGMIVYVTSRENPKTPSLCDIWVGVDFQEREVFDLLGIVFDGHPDLRRILLDESFKGHPLRKDYPLSGKWEDMLAVDAHLDEHQVRILKEEAGQEFRPEDVPPSFKR